MKNKHFQFSINKHLIKAEAEQESDCRYMVRMIVDDAPRPTLVRIGYLTGSANTWQAEFFGGRVINAPSARLACLELVTLAIRQPGLKASKSAKVSG